MRFITIDTLYSVLQWASAVTLLLTFLVGLPTILVGLRVNKEGNLKIRRLEIGISEARLETERIKADADERIAALTADAAKYKADSDERIAALTAEAERSRESAALAQLRTQELAMALEMERRDLGQLKRDVGDRSVSPEELRIRLERFQGTLVAVEYVTNNPEARSFAGQIAAGLSWAKWREPQPEGTPEWVMSPVVEREVSKFEFLRTGPMATGLTIAIPTQGHTAGTALAEALVELGVKRPSVIKNSWLPGVVHVIVGLKSMPLAIPRPQGLPR